MIVIRDPKIFYFDYDWSKDVDENLKHEIEFIIKNNESDWFKDVDENLKHEIEFIIKNNESLAENKIKKRD